MPLHENGTRSRGSNCSMADIFGFEKADLFTLNFGYLPVLPQTPICKSALIAHNSA